LRPRHELWLEVFCYTVGRLDNVRCSLASVLMDADRTESEREERKLAELVREQLSILGFDSEREFRQALEDQVQ
jgi:hypothetical protein